MTLTFTPKGGKKHAKTVAVTVTEQGATTLTGVSITGSGEISYNASNVELTAVPEGVTEGVSYAWEITTETAGATLDTNTGAAVKLSVNNEAAEEVTVSVKVTATYNGTSKDTTKNIKVSAHGVIVKDEVTGVTITGTNVANKAVTIDADGEIALTADISSTGSPAITYAWEVTDADGVIASKSGENTQTLTLTANNTATASKTVTVKVTVGDKSDEVTITVSGKVVTVYDLTDEGTNVDGAITGEINLGYGSVFGNGTQTLKDNSPFEYKTSNGEDLLPYVKVTGGNNIWADIDFSDFDDGHEKIRALETKSSTNFKISVKNVAAFEVITKVTNGELGARNLSVKVDDGTAQIFKPTEIGKTFSSGLILTGSTDEHSITLTSSTSATIYIGYIKLYNEKAALAGVKAQWEALLANYTGDNAAKGAAAYYWEGGAAVASAVAATPSTFAEYSAAITALKTAVASATVYVKPTAITVKAAATDTEIETGTPYEHSRLASETLALVASEDEGATGKLTWTLTSAGDTNATLESATDGASATLKTLTANGTVTLTVSDTDSRAENLSKVITISVTAEEIKVATGDEITVTATPAATGIGSKITLSATPTKTYTEDTTGKWYKTVNGGVETEITLTDGAYTTVAADAGSVVFTYKLTGAGGGIASASAEAVAVNFHVTKAGTVWKVPATPTGDITSTVELDGGVTALATSGKKLTSSASSVTHTDGTEFGYRMATNGSGTKTERALSFTVDAAATLYVYGEATGSSDERKIVVATSSGTEVGTSAALSYDSSKAVVDKVAFDLSAAGTYVIYSSNAAGIYGFLVKSPSAIKFTKTSQDIGQGKTFDVSSLLTNSGTETVTYSLTEGTASGITISGSTVSVADSVEVGTTATVKATAGDDTATITVKVVEYVAVDSVSFVKDGETITTLGVNKGLTVDLNSYLVIAAAAEGKTPTNTDITWSKASGGSDNITLDKTTGKVTVSASAVAGTDTATITATSKDNTDKSASITISVLAAKTKVGVWLSSNAVALPEGVTALNEKFAKSISSSATGTVSLTNTSTCVSEVGYSLTKLDGNSGANLASGSTTEYISVSVNSVCTLSFTSANKPAKFVKVVGDTESVVATQSSVGEFSQELAIGTYKIYNAAASGGKCQVKYLVFEY